MNELSISMLCMSSVPTPPSDAAEWYEPSVSCSTVVRVVAANVPTLRLPYHDSLDHDSGNSELLASHWSMMVLMASSVYGECSVLHGFTIVMTVLSAYGKCPVTYLFTMVIMATLAVYAEDMLSAVLRRYCNHCRLTTVAGNLDGLHRVTRRLSVYDREGDTCRFTTAALPFYNRSGLGFILAVELL